MPNTKSAKRKVKKVAKQAIANKFWKRRSKLAIKKMEGILQKKDAKEAKKYFSNDEVYTFLENNPEKIDVPPFSRDPRVGKF